MALATLCSLLHNLAAALPAAVQAAAPGSGSNGGAATLSLCCKALRGLRHALADASQLPEAQGVSSAAIAGLAFDCMVAVRLAPPGSEAAAGALQVAADAMDCVHDLLGKYFGAEAGQRLLEVVVPRLQVRLESRGGERTLGGW